MEGEGQKALGRLRHESTYAFSQKKIFLFSSLEFADSGSFLKYPFCCESTSGLPEQFINVKQRNSVSVIRPKDESI